MNGSVTLWGHQSTEVFDTAHLGNDRDQPSNGKQIKNDWGINDSKQSNQKQPKKYKTK